MASHDVVDALKSMMVERGGRVKGVPAAWPKCLRLLLMGVLSDISVIS